MNRILSTQIKSACKSPREIIFPNKETNKGASQKRGITTVHVCGVNSVKLWIRRSIPAYNLPRLYSFARARPQSEGTHSTTTPTICIRRKGWGSRGSEQNELASRSSWASLRARGRSLRPHRPVVPLRPNVRTLSLVLGEERFFLCTHVRERARRSCTSNHINHVMVYERFL